MKYQEDVLRFFSTFDLNEAESNYINGQAKRIAYLRNLCQKYCSGAVSNDILDVGPHFLTRYLLETITPRPRISTIGFEYPKLTPESMRYKHATINLNDCATAALPFDGLRFDIIVICEVIEHLFVPPDVVFTFLSKLLKRPGGIMICGTPNATSITKRLRMMMGYNPFQALLPENMGHGHIREYTMLELGRYGEEVGLAVILEEYCNYWDQYQFPGNDEFTRLENEIPLFMGGLTIVYQV